MANIIGRKYPFYPRILSYNLKTFVYSPALRFALLIMFSSAVIVRREQIILSLFPFKVITQYAARILGNPDREGSPVLF